MRPIQIEGWALDIISRVESGQPNEDSRVELKSLWIEPEKAARRLAGHANAARGEPILWLIGVDQNQGVVGAQQEELSEWFNKVKAEFDGIAPSLIDLVVPYDHKSVVALFFETDRAPYIVKVPSFSKVRGVSVSHEVPWREGTEIRTARRSDLLKILIPITHIPEIELLAGELFLSERNSEYHWDLELELYIDPEIGALFSIPYHRCQVSFEIVDALPQIQMGDIRLVPAYKLTTDCLALEREPDSYTIARTKHELIVHGPGFLRLYAYHQSNEDIPSLRGTNSKISVRMLPTHIDRAIILEYTMNWRDTDKDHIGFWKTVL